MVKKTTDFQVKVHNRKKAAGRSPFFIAQKDGIQARPEYEEPHSLACSATCEDEDLYYTIAISKPFAYICSFVKTSLP